VIACLDVDYRADSAMAACLLLEQWTSTAPAAELTRRIDGVAPYEPGQFYRRELPGLLAVLSKLSTPPDVAVIDGYVWLDDAGRPGLGAYLFEALDGASAVVGVAKNRFFGGASLVAITRGSSRRPLFVTAAGMAVRDAAAAIRSMAGPFRLPDMLKRVDQLCRAAW
jgi:deoxyribonuclease V